jgi:hypothetical protein
MNKKIDNPADREVRSVIIFLNAQNVRAIDIHRQLTAVYDSVTVRRSKLTAGPITLVNMIFVTTNLLVFLTYFFTLNSNTVYS